MNAFNDGIEMSLHHTTKIRLSNKGSTVEHVNSTSRSMKCRTNVVVVVALVSMLIDVDEPMLTALL